MNRRREEHTKNKKNPKRINSEKRGKKQLMHAITISCREWWKKRRESKRTRKWCGYIYLVRHKCWARAFERFCCFGKETNMGQIDGCCWWWWRRFAILVRSMWLSGVGTLFILEHRASSCCLRSRYIPSIGCGSSSTTNQRYISFTPHWLSHSRYNVGSVDWFGLVRLATHACDCSGCVCVCAAAHCAESIANSPHAMPCIFI